MVIILLPLTNILGACLTAKPSKKYSTTQKWFLKDIVLKLTSPSENCKICKTEKGLPKTQIMNESYNSIGVYLRSYPTTKLFCPFE